MSKINIMPFVIRDNKPFGFCVYPPGATLGPRVLLDFELVWLESGGALWVCNDVEYQLPSNAVILVKPGDREFFQWHKTQHTSHYFFHFDLDKTCSPDIDLLKYPEDWAQVRLLPKNNVLKPMLMHAFWLLKSGKSDKEPILQSILQQILLTFVSGKFELEQGALQDLPPALNRVFEFIEQDWSSFPLSKPSLTTLAKKAAVSPMHLCRLFNSEFGISPIAAITAMRLERAAALLARTNYPVNQIADLAGFENQYHFSTVFTRKYGICPSKYRKNTLEGRQLPTPKYKANFHSRRPQQ